MPLLSMRSPCFTKRVYKVNILKFHSFNTKRIFQFQLSNFSEKRNKCFYFDRNMMKIISKMAFYKKETRNLYAKFLAIMHCTCISNYICLRSIVDCCLQIVKMTTSVREVQSFLWSVVETGHSFCI